MLGLGIESSCDETAIAVVEDGSKCLANVIFSQIEQHAPFHGVVPEIASRAHLEQINFVYEQALKEAQIHELQQLDYIAVTVQPGLVGSLMIGAAFAKCLAIVSKLPIVRVNHIIAHLYAPCLEGWQPEYPFIGVLLSGGNSSIYLVKSAHQLELLADTLDDACGEAFDKSASILGLPYPGGPAVEKKASKFAAFLATKQDSNNVKYNAQTNRTYKAIFPPLLKHLSPQKMAFSFSGIKTAVAHAHRNGIANDRICYDFQYTVFELIERNILKACRKTGIRRVVGGGGVFANDALRKRLTDLALKEQLQFVYPHKKVYCTDNAAMIASLAYFLRHTDYETTSLDFEVSSKNPHILN